MRIGLIAFLSGFLLLGGTAAADGFKVTDLQMLTPDASGYQGDGTFDARATEAKRLTVFCTGCSGMTAIDVILGRNEDGTEQRYRSGETTIEKMAGLCKANNPSCELEAVEQGDAVGWVTRYSLTSAAGSTAVLFLDGDQLVIRSIASDVETAAANGAHALKTIGSQIIGRD